MHPKLIGIEEIALKRERKGMSKFYRLLMAHFKDSTLDKLNAWRTDLHEDISEADWNEACLRAQTQTVNTRLKLLQYKWLTRVYITPEILNHISCNIPDTCTKCGNHKGTLVHCVWECVKIQMFWQEVIQCLTETFHIKIPLSAKLCILGVYPEGLMQTKKHVKLLDCMLEE